MTRSWLSRTVVTLAAVALLGACGGGDSDSATTSTSVAPGAVTTVAGAVTSAAAGGAEPSSTVSVDIKNTAFSPKDVAVKVGGTVTWTFSDTIEHQVVADDDSFKSGTLSAGGKFPKKFDKAGTISYHCGVHPFMKGTVSVVVT